MIYTPGLWLFIISSLILAGIIVYSWPYRRTETGRNFVYLMLCAFTWAFFFTFETAISSLQGKIFFAILEFIGITYLPVSWVSLVWAFTGRRSTRREKFLLAAIPTLTNLVIWTNPLHHWFMGNPTINLTSAPFPVLNPDYQFWFYLVHAPAGYVFILIAFIILLRSIKKMEKVYQIQGFFLLVSLLLPTISDILYVLGYSPVKHYNYTPAIFSISGILLVWSLFRFHFLDLVPLAHDTVINNLRDGLIVLDHYGRIIDINPAVKKILNISDDVIGMSIQFSSGEFFQKIDLLIQNNQPQMDIKIDGDPDRYYDLQVIKIKKPHGLHIGWVATFRDITDRIYLYNQAKALAIQDSLTGIFNRRHFLDLCTREISRLQRSPDASSSVVMIDLDNFKIVNDTFGHACGDRVLIHFVKILQSGLRDFDIFGRVGGEEFSLMLIDVTLEESLNIAERLRAEIESMMIPVGDQTIQITASFGVISSQQIPKTDLEILKMLDLADRALYQAKQAGRNRVTAYTPGK